VSSLLAEYGLFAAKAFTLLIVIVLLLGALAATIRAARQPGPGERLEITNLNARYRRLGDAIKAETSSTAERKQLRKTRKAEQKKRQKSKPPEVRARIFVLDFDGDLRASATEALREEISAIVQVARPGDEVLLRLESAGGLVHAYGLAAAQLQRLRARELKLTVAVDRVAASGGYMMAAVADHIVAAPFAILGSIGVVAQLPNLHRLLKKHDVDVELHTAGAYKRTLTVFGENTEAGRSKFREELEQTHGLFKQFISEHRPAVSVEQVATGEHWYGTQALTLNLADELLTSDDWLLKWVDKADLLHLTFRQPQGLAERLSSGLIRMGLGLRQGAEAALRPPASLH
jgi:serine protease SohB